MERFAGQVAVVTGAGGGISSAIIKELLKRNVNVVGLDINSEKLLVLAGEVGENRQLYCGKFYSKICHISDDEQVRTTFEWINKQFKTFSILINGAGVCVEGTNDIQNIEAEHISSTFDANVKGLLLCVREVLNSMIPNSVVDHIINVCSVVGYDKNVQKACPIYTGSKQAVRVFSNLLRNEIIQKRANIKITTLSPGVTNTGLTRDIIENLPITKDEVLSAEEIANGCISVLDTAPHVLISEISIEPIYQVSLSLKNI